MEKAKIIGDMEEEIKELEKESNIELEKLKTQKHKSNRILNTTIIMGAIALISVSVSLTLPISIISAVSGLFVVSTIVSSLYYCNSKLSELKKEDKYYAIKKKIDDFKAAAILINSDESLDEVLKYFEDSLRQYNNLKKRIENYYSENIDNLINYDVSPINNNQFIEVEEIPLQKQLHK